MTQGPSADRRPARRRPRPDAGARSPLAEVARRFTPWGRSVAAWTALGVTGCFALGCSVIALALASRAGKDPDGAPVSRSWWEHAGPWAAYAMLFVCAGGLFALAGRRGRIVGAIMLMVALVVPWAAFAGLLAHGVLARGLDVGHALGVAALSGALPALGTIALLIETRRPWKPLS